MKEISVKELKAMMDSGEDFQLIDVRQPIEYETGNIGGEPIPLNEIMWSADKIARNKKVIIQCKSGGRSAQAVMLLETDFGFDNLYNLAGGIMAWASQIDSNIKVY